MPGFGDSAAPPDGQDADVLPHWIDKGVEVLLGRQTFDLVGFSFGGLVAGLFAARYPERVQRLVLVGAPALSAEPLAPLDLRPWHAVPQGPARDAIHRHNLGSLMLAHDASIDALAVELHTANVERDRLRQRRLMLTDLLLRTLPDIDVPWRESGGPMMCSIARARRRLSARSAQAPDLRSLVFIPQAGHWVQYEQPAAFDAKLALALGQTA